MKDNVGRGAETADPSDDRKRDVSLVLQSSVDGDEGSFGRLFELIYDGLHHVACQYMAGHPSHTLQPTALVHEAYLRMVDSRGAEGRSRDHFFAVAARAMRHVLIDYHKTRNRQKRGGGAVAVPLDQVSAFYEEHGLDALAIHELLEKMRDVDPFLVQVVDLKVFLGLPMDEVARMLGRSKRDVERRWTTARAWLQSQMQDHDRHGP